MPQYDIELHRAAKEELSNLHSDKRERITNLITEISEIERPTSHSHAKHMEGQKSLFRIRAGKVRAVCILDKPTLRVLKIGKRDTVYRYIDDIEERMPA